MAIKYEDLKKKIEAAQKFRKNEFESRAKRNLDWYQSKYFEEVKDHLLDEHNNYNYRVNLAYGIVRTMVSSIYSKTPEFSTAIKGGQDKSIYQDEDLHTGIKDAMGMNSNIANKIQLDKLGKCLELGLKILIHKQMKINRTNRRCITDACIFGYGVGKQGYKINTDKKTESHITNPEKLSQIGLSIDDLEESDLVKNEKPYLVRKDPRRFLFPPDAEDFDRLPWVAEEIFVDAKKANSKFKMDFKPTHTTEFYHDENDKLCMDKIKFYEVHSFDEDDDIPKIYILAEGHNGIVKTKNYPTYNEKTGEYKNICHFIWFNDSVDGFYPQSDLDLVASQIMEANIQIRRRVECIKKFSTQYVLSGQWPDDVVKDIKTGQDGDVHHTPDPDAKINALPKLQLGMEFYQNIKAIKDEMHEVLGITDYQRGGETQQRKATEAQLVDAGRKDRVGERVVIIEEWVFNQIDTLIELLKAHKVTDTFFKYQFDGEDIPIKLSKELLQLVDLDISIIPGSSIELDRNFIFRRNEALAKLSQAFGPVANMPVVYEEAVRGLGFANPERFVLNREPQPVMMPGADGATPRMKREPNQPGEPTRTPLERNEE